MNPLLLTILSTIAPIPCSGDIYDALQSRINACYSTGGEQCVIALSAGQCFVREVVELCPTVELEGVSEQHTKLKFPTGESGFHVLPYEQCQLEGKPWVGRVRLDRMTIRGTNSSTITYGLHINNHVRLDRLEISDFTQGINLTADVNAPMEGNANMFRMSEIHIYRTWHSGMVIDGGDANTGLLSQVSIDSQACLDPEQFEATLGPCHAVWDDGFLGNVYVATHVSDVRNGGLPYYMSNPNARHVLLGAYTEANLPYGYLSPTSLALGGLALWNGLGTWVQGRDTNGFRIINDLDPTNVVKMELGEAAGLAGTFYTLRANSLNPGWPLRMAASPTQGVYFMDIANLGVNSSILRWTGVNGTGYPLGTLRLRSTLLNID